jgi:hypothetical protein
MASEEGFRVQAYLRVLLEKRREVQQPFSSHYHQHHQFS